MKLEVFKINYYKLKMKLKELIIKFCKKKINKIQLKKK